MVIDYIKTLLSAGWSQGRISRESGIPQPSINRLLKGGQSDVHYTHGKRLEELAAKVGAGETAVVNDSLTTEPMKEAA